MSTRYFEFTSVFTIVSSTLALCIIDSFEEWLKSCYDTSSYIAFNTSTMK